MFGLFSFMGQAPVGATVMITLFMIDPSVFGRIVLYSPIVNHCNIHANT